METITLGRTGLRASVAGLGCGGPSRLGMRTGKSEAESIAVVRTALDLGVNFIDTAEAYGTEESVGKALAHVPRNQVIISTKKGVYHDGAPVSGVEFARGVEASLQRLGVDTVDLLHLHGVRPEQYAHARDEIVPVLQRLREQGKIQYLGVTEAFERDTRHEMLAQALDDDWADVVMVGYNMLNQSAARTVLPRTQAQNVGTLCMFAVRRAFSRPEHLATLLDELAARGEVGTALASDDAPLAFLTANGAAASVMDAAYRFCRYTPGLDVILTGTGEVEHLRANVASILRPPLPPDVVARIEAIFGRVDSVSGS